MQHWFIWSKPKGCDPVGGGGGGEGGYNPHRLYHGGGAH